MKICYIDEAGCTGALPSAVSDIQPAFVIVGLIIDYSQLHTATERLIGLKRRFFPGLVPTNTTYLDWMLAEVKGTSLRKMACAGSRNPRRAALGCLDNFFTLLEDLGVKIAGRVWIKPIGAPFVGRSVYTYSIQTIYDDFQDYLNRANDVGIVIADSRAKGLNTNVSHSIFTQKFKSSGDNYDRIIEMPAFAHSDNHAGLQLCDVLVSGVIFPLAMNAYCDGFLQTVHVKPNYLGLRQRYGMRLRALQHRYQEASGRTRFGLTISDGLAGRNGYRLFDASA